MKARIAAAVAAVACAGCVGVHETPPPPPARAAVTPPVVVVPPPVAAPTVVPPKPERAIASEAKAPEIEALLAEFARLRRLPPSEIAREQEAARQSWHQSRTDMARTRYAMTSSLPGVSPAEELRALDLLEPLVKNTSAPLHGLAFMLSAFIQEQRRLASLVHGLQQNVQGLQQNNQVLQQNVHGLQQKLDALRTLERSLSERGEPVQRRR